jgi:hypothetical protein
MFVVLRSAKGNAIPKGNLPFHLLTYLLYSMISQLYRPIDYIASNGKVIVKGVWKIMWKEETLPILMHYHRIRSEGLRWTTNTFNWITYAFPFFSFIRLHWACHVGLKRNAFAMRFCRWEFVIGGDVPIIASWHLKTLSVFSDSCFKTE